MKTYTIQESAGRGRASVDYAKELNPEQYRVVTKGGGRVLVLAGPGSGKTRTLVYRVAYLLDTGISPRNILLVTFTNRAAREMLSRVEILLKYKPHGLWGGTFHHIGNLCLRRYADMLGYNKNFSILDREDSRNLIKSCIEELKINIKEKRFPKPGVIEAIINYSANCMQSIETVIKTRYFYFESLIFEINKVAEAYVRKKKLSNLMDYDDLLTKWLELLKNVPEANEFYTMQFKYILVDEYQDTNRLQYELIKILSGHHNNILVVGDDAQSIYSFRSADIRNILEFPQQFPDAKIFRLESNYRSTSNILKLANASIKHNMEQFPKHLKSLRGSGGKPVLVRLKDTNQQSSFIAQRILELRDEGVPLNDIAVLFRARYQSAELEMELLKRDIPYIVRGGVRFFEQRHIKDVLAHLKIIINPRDELSWKRILQLQQGIGSAYAHKIWLKICEGNDIIDEFLKSTFSDFSAKIQGDLNRFRRTLRRITSEEMLNHPSEIIQEIVKKGYDEYVRATFDNAADRLQDLEQLANLAENYHTLQAFLYAATLGEDFKGETILNGRNEDEYIILSTIHQAKGLEWRVVIIIGAVDGQFPHPKSLDEPAQIEEERRLFYVAVTRSKDELYITQPMLRFDRRNGRVITAPSRFIQELSQNCLEEWSVTEEYSGNEVENDLPEI